MKLIRKDDRVIIVKKVNALHFFLALVTYILSSKQTRLDMIRY